MIVTISSKSTPEEIKNALEKLEKGRKEIKEVKRQDSRIHITRKTKGKFNAFNYCGIIKLKKDPLDIQKEMRNEWD